MRHIRGRGQSGQTIPFWIFSLIISLALSLFVMNYTDTIRWHMRAQNAADAVALASMAGEAGLQNEITMAQYTAAVDEYRVRSIMYAAINAANGDGASPTQSQVNGATTSTCDPSTKYDDNGVDCDNAYDQEPRYYDQAVAQYAAAVAQLEALKNPPVPSIVTPAPVATGVATPQPVGSSPPGSSVGAAFSLAQSHQYCWDQPTGNHATVFDCAFNYTADLSHTGPTTSNPTSTETVDVTACRMVTSRSPGLLARVVPGLSRQFSAIARSAATLIPITEPTFTPTSAQQPVESCPASNCDIHAEWLNSSSYTTDYSGLIVQPTFYTPVLAHPLASPQETRDCAAG